MTAEIWATPRKLCSAAITARIFCGTLSTAASIARSNRITRAMLMETPPSLDAGEATDKGSLNQRMVLKHRAALVDELYADTPSGRVIALDEKVTG